MNFCLLRHVYTRKTPSVVGGKGKEIFEDFKNKQLTLMIESVEEEEDTKKGTNQI